VSPCDQAGRSLHKPKGQLRGKNALGLSRIHLKNRKSQGSVNGFYPGRPCLPLMVKLFTGVQRQGYFNQLSLLQNDDFRSASRHAKKFYRRHIIDITRIKFKHNVEVEPKGCFASGSVTRKNR